MYDRPTPFINGVKTNTINLLKPDRQDDIYVDDINYNMDVIDEEVYKLKLELSKKVNSTDAEFFGTVTINGDTVVTNNMLNEALEVELIV